MKRYFSFSLAHNFLLLQEAIILLKVLEKTGVISLNGLIAATAFKYICCSFYFYLYLTYKFVCFWSICLSIVADISLSIQAKYFKDMSRVWFIIRENWMVTTDFSLFKFAYFFVICVCGKKNIKGSFDDVCC